MSKLDQPKAQLAEARPFASMNRLNPNAAGVDIGARKILVRVAGEANTQLVRSFGVHPPDLQTIAVWLKGHHDDGSDDDDLPPLPDHKRKSHSKNAPRRQGDIRKHLKRICGVDAAAIHGLGVSLAQQAVMETGTDMSTFPTEKHFCSWLGLAPKREISGGKVLRSATLKTRNCAGQTFRKAAASVMRSDGVFGVFYRRMKARLGPAQAAVAAAHFIARAAHRMLKYKVEYQPADVEAYRQKYRRQPVKSLQRKAARLGFQLTPA